VLEWTRSTIEGGGTRITLRGEIDESSDLLKLAEELSGPVTLDMGGIRRVNSAGILLWQRFIAAVKDKVSPLVLERCSPQVVVQVSIVPGFLGPATVASAYAVYYCPKCSKDVMRLIDFSRDRSDQLDAPLLCDTCNQPMTIDELPQALKWFRGER
jgi:hypothetical protein